MSILQKYIPLLPALIDRIRKATQSVIFHGLLIASIMTGCAPAVVVQQERYFWPSPPNPPRIEWLGSYHSQLDLEMTPFRRFREAIVGEDTPISLIKPAEVRADAVLNKIYVADSGASCVYVFDLSKGELRTLSTHGSGLPALITPIGMAIDKDGNLYVLEPRHRKILVYNSSEVLIHTINLIKFSHRPVALAIDKNRGRLYVSDVKLNKIFALDLNGDMLFNFGDSGSGDGAFNRPVGITIASGGDVIVADAFNARIQIFTESGTFRRAFGKRGDRSGDFQLIKSVAVDQDDNIYVVDGRSHSVSIFNQAGDPLLVIGDFYAVSTSGKMAPGGFLLPSGIDIDSRGRIFIADQMNARVQVFQYLPDKPTSTPDSHQVK